MKRKIKLWDYAGQILETISNAALVTAKADGKVNSMTIGWGGITTEWHRPIFVLYVRESRFTKQLLDQNPEFTINVPYGDDAKEILKFCGTKSGRDVDKVAALGLELVESEQISVPGIRQLPLTLECKVIYRREQDPAAIPEDITRRSYPPFFPDGRGDYHTVYYGQILDAYIIED